MDPAPDQLTLFYRFGTALIIGLLVGIQREYAFRNAAHHDDDELFAGVRTFTLMALLGCAAAFGADVLDAPAVFIALLVLAGALITVAYHLSSRRGDLGLTTEMAALLTIFTGALCYWGFLELAAALAVTTTVILALKIQARSLIREISPADVYATLKFAVISLIVLPLLPRTPIGPAPFDVLVPYNVWLMVVFISGISFLGYVLIKVVGARRGVGLTGILGGLVSSTAVTLSFAQRSRTAGGWAGPFALAILLAWTIMFLRVIVEVAALNQALLAVIWLPMAAAAVVGFGYAAYLFFRRSPEQHEATEEFKNPFALGPAVTFGLLYAVILVVARTAQLYFGETGIYLSSIASGLADVDAITLSMARLSGGTDGVALTTAARAIVLAAAANTLVKGGIVLAAGSAALRRLILPGLVLLLGTAIGVVFML